MTLSPAAGSALADVLLPQVEGKDLLLPHRFVKSWLQHGSRTAIIDGSRGDTPFSYQNFALGTHLFASWLTHNTDMSAQNYAILLPSGMGFATAFFACQLLGKTVVPLNYALSPREVLDIVRDAEATTVISFEPDPNDRASNAIFGQTLEYLNDEILALTPVLINHHHVQGRIRHEEPWTQMPDLTPDDLAVLLYTSGSTGKPKGVMQTHRNLVTNADAAAELLKAGEDDVLFSALPTFHSFALTAGMLFPLLHGLTAFMEPRFMPRSVLSRLGPNKTTIHLGVPSMYKAFLGVSRMKPSDAFAGVRYCISGGAPMPPEIAGGFRQIYGKDIHEGYGCTETSPVISLNPLDQPNRLSSVGRPIPGVTVEIRDANGQAVPQGETGEIWVTGPNVTLGYYKKPEETAQVFHDGWYNTQDMGMIDQDGYVFILGRTKHMIIVGGENVYPAEVEAAVIKVPEVQDVAVTGAPDETRGEIVHAYVVPAAGWTGDAAHMESTIREYLSHNNLLGSYKIPHQVTLLEQIPLLPTGKPDLPTLRGERQMITNVAVLQAQAAAIRADMEAAAQEG